MGSQKEKTISFGQGAYQQLQWGGVCCTTSPSTIGIGLCCAVSRAAFVFSIQDMFQPRLRNTNERGVLSWLRSRTLKTENRKPETSYLQFLNGVPHSLRIASLFM